MFSSTEKATQKRAKLHNKRLVLKTIYDRGPISRADIARATHLARTTVSNVVTSLMAEGLVLEVGQRLLERGKPATLLRVDDDARHIIGIDLGGREFNGVIADLRGAIIQRRRTPLADLTGEAALERVYQLLDALVAAADEGALLGIGIGAPGVVDASLGVIHQSGRLQWRDMPLRQLLEDRYHLPVHIANDSHVAALGEYTFGNGHTGPNLVVITVGMGVSAGVVLDGRLHLGDSFGAGEIGHVTVVTGPEAQRCSCGNTGCLETVVSEGALIAQARDIARRNPQSKLHQFAPTSKAIDLQAILQAFNADDDDLNQVILQMGRRLGYSVATVVSILNVEQVIISGSLARFGAPLIQAIRTEFKSTIHPMLAAKTKIHPSHLGQDIVVKGAVATVLSAEMALV